MLILTGQTSEHAPQSDEANGNGTASPTGFSDGVSAEPIGPPYTEPYACPPTLWYTGQMFRQAPQRMQYSASRMTGSASIALRLLSTSI